MDRSEQADPEPPPPVASDIEGALQRFTLPLVLINLDTFTICGATPSLLTLFGATGADIIGRPLKDLLYPPDAAAAVTALTAVRDGVIDFYRSERPLGFVAAPTVTPVTGWVRSVVMGGQHYALAEFSMGTAPVESPLAAYFGKEPRVMALGTADNGWVISAVSSDVGQVMGQTSEEVVGRNLLGMVAEEDVPGLLAADRVTSEDYSVARSVRMRDGAGGWRILCFVLTPLKLHENRSFMLFPTDTGPNPASSRVAELERHLWRIAAEVEASGVLRRVAQGPDISSLRGLEGLSARQWEVLSRLLQGERVPTIAEEMFISQSTVRNHLSAIFERFGVHSQAELLAVLRSAPGPEPETPAG